MSPLLFGFVSCATDLALKVSVFSFTQRTDLQGEVSGTKSLTAVDEDRLIVDLGWLKVEVRGLWVEVGFVNLEVRAVNIEVRFFNLLVHSFNTLVELLNMLLRSFNRLLQLFNRLVQSFNLEVDTLNKRSAPRYLAQNAVGNETRMCCAANNAHYQHTVQ